MGVGADCTRCFRTESVGNWGSSPARNGLLDGLPRCARRVGRHEPEVTQFGFAGRSSVVKLPINHHAPAHATSQRHVEHVPESGGNSLSGFAQGRDVGIVLDPHLSTGKLIAQPVGEGKSGPAAHLMRGGNATRLPVYGSAEAHTNGLRGFGQLADCLAELRQDPVGPPRRINGVPKAPGDLTGCIARHQLEFGTPNFNPKIHGAKVGANAQFVRL